jgi:hypothetical protein
VPTADADTITVTVNWLSKLLPPKP